MERTQESGRVITSIPLIYVAGPFAGETNYDVQQNVNRAETIALAVALGGGLGVCPHTMNRNFFGQKDEAFWLAAVMELLRRCDGIVLAANWEASKGARAEWQLAMELKLPHLVWHDGHGLGAAHMRLERWIAGVKAGKPAGSLIEGV